MKFTEALTFDDVLLTPSYADFLPAEACTKTHLTRDIELGIPLVSAAMDTVTESALAIAMAQHGGVGCIHKNFSIEDQAREVRKVKKFESGMVVDPITISPDGNLSQVLSLMEEHRISGIPVTDGDGKLVGIITNRDVRFAQDPDTKVRDLMTSKDLVTVREDITPDQAKKLLHTHRIEKLIVVSEDFRCTGLITVKDIEKSRKYPNAAKDDAGRLRVIAAVGTSKQDRERAEALLEAGVDALVVDTAHGHSQGVISAVKEIKRALKLPIIAGNIVTPDAAKALAYAGVDAVKVGVGPGSICTTRIVAGVGMPQLSAIMEISKTCRKAGVKLIADGGVKYSGDLAKAIAAGADAVMIGSLFAGTKESPGEIILYQGRSYKSYRGMGSLGAMARGSADRYFQQEVRENLKYVPEGVEGRVPYKGSVADVIHQLIGGLRAAMGYTGNRDITHMQRKCEFVRITGAGLRESHAHDVTITHEAPNYRVEG